MKYFRWVILSTLVLAMGNANANQDTDHDVLKNFLDHPEIAESWDKRSTCKKASFYEMYLRSNNDGLPFYSLDGQDLFQIARALYKHGKTLHCWSFEGSAQLRRIAADLSSVYPEY